MKKAPLPPPPLAPWEQLLWQGGPSGSLFFPQVRLTGRSFVGRWIWNVAADRAKAYAVTSHRVLRCDGSTWHWLLRGDVEPTLTPGTCGPLTISFRFHGGGPAFAFGDLEEREAHRVMALLRMPPVSAREGWLPSARWVPSVPPPV